ncbi:MAG TPA: alpha/beta fold hydrolase [Gemmatimonadaceae bacterium]
MIYFIVFAVILSAGAVWRARRIEALSAESMRRRPLGANGIVVGGESIVLERAGAPAVLIIHGAGDTPQTVRYLADALFAHGYHVEAPLLPGHGRQVRDFRRVNADDWFAAVRVAFTDLARVHSWVSVIGVSMGGALAVQLAAEHPDIPALGLVAPYLTMPKKIDRAARLAWLWGVASPVVRSAEGLSILDPTERERNLAYGVFTSSALRALHATVLRAAAALPRVKSPTLFVQSRGDNRIAVCAAEQAFVHLGAKERRLEWIEGAAHVITVDYGRENVIAMLVAWMDEHRARVQITQ